MKKILLILAMLVASAAHAETGTNTLQSMGFNDLPEAERAAIVQQVAAAKAKVVNDQSTSVVAQVSTPQKVGEWLDVGTKIGQMFGGAAKEVGLAVNDFVKTPVGQWTMFIIIWKFMGGAIIHVLAGLCVLVIGTTAAAIIFRNARTVTVLYDMEKTNWFGNHPLQKMVKGNLDSDYVAGALCVQGLTIVVSLIAIFTF